MVPRCRDSEDSASRWADRQRTPHEILFTIGQTAETPDNQRMIEVSGVLSLSSILQRGIPSGSPPKTVDMNWRRPLLDRDRK